MTVVNKNRDELSNLTRKWRHEDQIQRLETYNTLLAETLQELHDVQGTAQRTGQSGEQYAQYIATMKKVKKVLA